MSGLGFLVPAWWPVLLALPLALLVARRRGARRQALRRAALGPRHGAPPARTGRLGALWLPGFLLLAAATLLQPIAGTEAGEPVGPEVVFCVDVSWSMAAQDVPPSRLRRAVGELAAVAERARGARFGLLAFAGEARLDVPLTADLAAVAVMAQQLAPGAELRGGTDLGAAIGSAADALRRGGAAGGAVVLLTDGEDFGGAGQQAAARAREQGLVVHCLGYGTETGSKIAVEDDEGQRFLRDDSGEEVISALDPAGLRAVAAAGGGDYGAGARDGALAALYDGALVPRAEAAARASGERVVAHRFQWPLLLALLLWMLRALMSEGSR